MKLNWSRIIIGILGSILFGILGLAAIVGLVIAFSAADTIQDVQNLPRYAVITSIMVGLGCAWGAFVSLRKLPAQHLVHGFSIGLGVGLLNFAINPAPFMINFLTLLMTIPAGIFGARMAQLNPKGVEPPST